MSREIGVCELGSCDVGAAADALSETHSATGFRATTKTTTLTDPIFEATFTGTAGQSVGRGDCINGRFSGQLVNKKYNPDDENRPSCSLFVNNGVLRGRVGSTSPSYLATLYSVGSYAPVKTVVSKLTGSTQNVPKQIPIQSDINTSGWSTIRGPNEEIIICAGPTSDRYCSPRGPVSQTATNPTSA